MSDLNRQFGDIDVYLFDQLLKGRLRIGQRVLDAGCGRGRNLVHLLREGYDVHAVDADATCVAAVRDLFAELAPALGPERVQQADVVSLPFDDDAFDVVISVAVLHFARDEAHFDGMLAELDRVLAPGGILFARLASDIGLEQAMQPLGSGRYRMPDGTDRYLVDEAALLQRTEALGATLLDPLKTTNVQGLRCMTTWVLRKGD